MDRAANHQQQQCKKPDMELGTYQAAAFAELCIMTTQTIICRRCIFRQHQAQQSCCTIIASQTACGTDGIILADKVSQGKQHQHDLATSLVHTRKSV